MRAMAEVHAIFGSKEQRVAAEKPWWRELYGVPPWFFRELPDAVWVATAVVTVVAILVGFFLPVPYLAAGCSGFLGMSVANLLRIRERRRRLLLLSK